jgi:mono/diheme cytochrome c family protein
MRPTIPTSIRFTKRKVNLSNFRFDPDCICKRHLSAVVLFMNMLLSPGTATAQTNSPPISGDHSVYAELAKAPRKAVSRRNPLETDPDAVAAGGKLFGMHCAECHGEMAQGGKKAPSLLAPEVQQATPGALFWLLTNGVVRHGMPVWSKLPEPQRWQLVTFIKSLSPAAPSKSDGENTAHP